MNQQLNVRPLVPVMVIAMAGLAGCGTAGRSDSDSKPIVGLMDTGPMVRAVDVVRASCVIVEYTLQYDKADSPGGEAAGAAGRGGANLEQFIREERPVERPGFLTAADRVITGDVRVHPRFINSIRVRFGDQIVEASVDAVAKDRSAMSLKLAGPLAGSKPLAFDRSKAGPFNFVVQRETDGVWGLVAGSLGGGFSASRGKQLVGAVEQSVVVTKDGTPVTLNFVSEVPADDSWKVAVESWPWVPAVKLGQELDEFATMSSSALPRVAMTFRSPRQDGSGGGRMGRGRGGNPDEDPEDRAMTEWNGTGVLLDDKRVLIPESFRPKTTGRLESVRVFVPGRDKPVEAKFAGSLRDYGAMVVTLDESVKGAVPAFAGDVTTLKDQLLYKADLSVLGETRTAYYSRDRFNSFYTSWRRQMLPSASASRDFRTGGAHAGNYLFTTDGKLVAVPVQRREKVTVEVRGGGGDYPILIPLAYINTAIADQKDGYEPQNRPMTEAEENRLAWLGVELQPMDPDLARLNNVADQTAGGRFGGIVGFVYPDSPASKAGLQVGDIILRLHITGQPKPLDVSVGDNQGFGAMMDQFWQMVDQIPDEYFDQMPKPWGSAETPVTRALTDVGFGTAFKADVFRDGKIVSKDFVVEQGPAHFDAAARLKNEASGISARDLTFEVRRYFQIPPAEAGVIVSKVEKGSRAAIAGIKPYEIITSIDDQPVKTVADLEAALAKGGELKLSVKRMTEGRTVKLRLK
jgi:serine protease Do